MRAAETLAWTREVEASSLVPVAWLTLLVEVTFHRIIYPYPRLDIHSDMC